MRRLRLRRESADSSVVSTVVCPGATRLFTPPAFFNQFDSPPPSRSYTYDAFQDLVNIRQKVVRNGVETVLSLSDVDKRYNIYPHRDRWGCWFSSLGGGGAGPTLRDAEPAPGSYKGERASGHLRGVSRALLADTPEEASRKKLIASLTFVLPDLTESRWEYRGPSSELVGREAELWEWDMSEMGMEMRYRMFVDAASGAPLQLWMLGVNLLTGGHKDLYIIDYYNFTAGGVSDADFELPAWGNCDTPDFAVPPNDLAAAWAPHFPSAHWGEPAYDAFSHRHGRRHAHADEYSARHAEFERSRAFVAGWMADAARTHDVALNRFADWSREEYEAVVLPNRRAGAPKRLFRDAPGALRHAVTTPAHLVPSQLSWVGTGADSPVKDQGACGSCWTFSTVAPFESGLFRLTGNQTLLSEQNLLDCNWMETNHGCFGGQQVAGFEWILNNGGLARQADYPYLGVNSWCRNDEVPKVGFTGSMVVVDADEEAVKEALYTKGPLTVSVDASADSFRFYSGGIYHNDKCATTAGDLDHAVILTAYGTDADGTDYWLIKNMWSTYWGEAGYMKIPRHPNDCGIATEAVYVDIELAHQ